MTLIELVAVIAIIGILSGFVVWRLGSFVFWREQSFMRKLSETLYFLHHQAVFDQAYYAMEFNMEDPKRPSYRVGVFSGTSGANSGDPNDPQNTVGGVLSLELAYFLSPSLDSESNFAPPPSFPSLADPVTFPEGVTIEDIRTTQGKHLQSEGGRVYVMFSPRGFSEFAVLHLRTSANQPLTLLVNPFNGSIESFPEYKDFRWTYGNKKKKH